jgi:hypothetical protein
VPLPVRIRFDEIPRSALPRSSTARFSEKWQESLGDESFLESVVERWRAAGVCGGLDAAAQAQLLAEAVNIPSGMASQRRPEAPGADSAHNQAASGHSSHAAQGEARPAALRRDPAPEPAAPAGGQSARLALRERLLRPQSPR